MEILPSPQAFPVNIEIIDQEYVFLEKSNPHAQESKGGLMIQDRELARELIAYVERNLSSKAPQHLKNTSAFARFR